MPDAAFDHPRLAALYDPLDPGRRDLTAYVDLVAGLGARSVLDVGCGTGTLACLLAGRGLDVVGVDPAAASLALARAKPFADRVRWVHGDATRLPPLRVDVATMTGNVAQVFLTDADWAATLAGVGGALRPGGHLVLETRVPAARAWEGWTPARTRARTDVPGVGVVESWCEVTAVEGALVSFRWTYAFAADGEVLASRSTLRFRDLAEVTDSLTEAGLVVVDVRDAPDRPGLEHVVVATRGGGQSPAGAPA